jgi:RNA polymerase sigma-70 factor (ECF subfamily)
MNNSQVEDAKVVAEVINGNTDAYGELILRYEPKLIRYVTYLIHDRTAASDVVQETFIKAYQNLRSYNSKYKFSSWIYRISHNEAMNAVKRVQRLSGADIDELPEIGYDPRLDELVDKKILAEDVHGCLGKLAPKYREVVQLVYFEHMKYEEASDVLHVPTSSIGVWLSRAKSQLREICKKRGVRR